MPQEFPGGKVNLTCVLPSAASFVKSTKQKRNVVKRFRKSFPETRVHIKTSTYAAMAAAEVVLVMTKTLRSKL